MNSRFRSLALTAISLGILLAASGCETSKCKTEEGENAVCAESLKRFTVAGTDQTLEHPYTDGMDLLIEGVKGNITVVQGSAGMVSVDIEPFTYRGHSKEDEARTEIEELFDAGIGEEDGRIRIFTTRLDGASDELGADLVVRIPPEFNGRLTIDNYASGEVNSGDVSVEQTAAAWAVDITNRNLVGTCNLDAVPTVTSTTVNCDDEIEIRGISDDFTVTTTGLNSKVVVEVVEISDAATGGTINSEDGPVDLLLPPVDAVQVNASTGEGAINIFDAGETCVAGDDDTELSKTMTCGDGGPVYTIKAGTDGVGASDIGIDFDRTNN